MNMNTMHGRRDRRRRARAALQAAGRPVTRRAVRKEARRQRKVAKAQRKMAQRGGGGGQAFTPFFATTAAPQGVAFTSMPVVDTETYAVEGVAPSSSVLPMVLAAAAGAALLAFA